jgi:hypothetical protein
MIKTITALLTTALITLMYITLSSNTSGLNSNHTGAASSFGGCNCHGSNSPATQIIITLDSQGQTVNSYVGGKTYNLIIKATNTSNLGYFGFQLASVSGSSSSQVQAGTWGAATSPASLTKKSILSSLSILQHSNKIPITAATNSYDIIVPWTAPTSGKGNVTFYCTINAVNGDGTDALNLDKPNSTSAVYLEQGASSQVVNYKNVKIGGIYPNPFKDKLFIKATTTNDMPLEIMIANLSGLIVYKSTLTNYNDNSIVNTNNLSSGFYIISLKQNNTTETMLLKKEE